jgi:hypothetical protein
LKSGAINSVKTSFAPSSVAKRTACAGGCRWLVAGWPGREDAQKSVFA